MSAILFGNAILIVCGLLSLAALLLLLVPRTPKHTFWALALVLALSLPLILLLPNGR